MCKCPHKKRKNSLRLKGFDYSQSNYIYFVTICTINALTPFTNPEVAHGILDSLNYLREREKISVYCYCLMPDHLHLLISLPESSVSLSEVLKRFKSFTTKRYREITTKKRLWQRSFYDHIVRREENLSQICEYILANPVRKGLVDDPVKYQYSGLLDPLSV